jgi:hypothetical protein
VLGVHELGGRALVLGREGAGEVERAAGDVRVDIDAAGEDDHAGGVDDASAVNVGNDLAVVDADVLDDAVDIVRGIVDFAAFDSKHGLPLRFGRHYSKQDFRGVSSANPRVSLCMGASRSRIAIPPFAMAKVISCSLSPITWAQQA